MSELDLWSPITNHQPSSRLYKQDQIVVVKIIYHWRGERIIETYSYTIQLTLSEFCATNGLKSCQKALLLLAATVVCVLVRSPEAAGKQQVSEFKVFSTRFSNIEYLFYII